MATPPTANPLPPPLRNSYWVLPGKVLAGEHPSGQTRDATRQRLQTLLEAGVECFIDLTQPNELTPYDIELPFAVEYLRKPIKDHSVPAERAHMIEILDCLHDALRTGRLVYVHCRAGIGRTGMVIGCLLVEHGLLGEEALDELNRLWQHCERSKQWMSVPETEEQCDYVRQWTPRATPSAGAAAQRGARFGQTSAGPALGRRPEPGSGAGASAGRGPEAPSGAGASAGRTAAVGTTASDDEPDPLLDPATLSAASGLRARFLGALLGLATGDAIAAATQFRRPGTFTPVGDMLGGGPFDLPRGAWSDDTAMALCLAESLLECGGFDARDQVERYLRWQQQGYLSATGQCVGITASTARALAVAQWRRQVFSGSHDPGQLDPEPLSRVAPIVMFFFAASGAAVEQASEAARTTCQAPAVLDACRVLARALHAALSGASKAAILAHAAAVPSAARAAAASPAGATQLPSSSGPAAAQIGAPEGPSSAASAAGGAPQDSAAQPAKSAYPGTTTAPEVLATVFEAFAATDNFRDAVLRAANLGGNSDVAAAVCGQLAGAHYTVSAIPTMWRNSLIEKALLENCADRLLAHAMVGLSG